MAIDMTKKSKNPQQSSSAAISQESHFNNAAHIPSDRITPDTTTIKFKFNAIDWLFLTLIVLVAVYAMFTFNMKILFILIMLAIGISINGSLKQKKAAKQIDYITHTPLPQNIWQNELLKDLNLSAADRSMIAQGLRDFFILRVMHPDKPIAMPSQYVDKLWHAFILDTRRYEEYCIQAFGKILHHIPDYAFSDHQNNIRMYTYQNACRIQGIEPAHPNNQVPRLFGVDHHINYVLGIITASALANQMQDATTQLAQGYQLWHANMMAAVNNPEVGFEFDAEINASGDASCGSSGSDGGGCGGGCGGD